MIPLLSPCTEYGGHLVKKILDNYYFMVLFPGPPRLLAPGAGRIIYQDKIIKFDKVPLVTPNGDILIDELSFEVK